MKTLVTGGAGFIGSHLCEALLRLGHDIIIVDDLSSGRKENIKTLMQHPQVIFVHLDITQKDDLTGVFDRVDWVFHLAGKADIVPSIENPTLYYQSNVLGTFNILQCAKEAQVKKLIYAASSSSYGIPDIYPTPESSPIRPQYPYALTKYMGEELVLHWGQVYGLPVLSLRLFNVYGPRSRTSGTYGAVFGVFLAQKTNNQPYTVVGDGTQTRDFTYVSDVVEAFISAAQSDCQGVVMNVGSGTHQSINRLVELLQGEQIHIPKRPGEPDCTYADVTKIHALLDWQAKVDFETGVAKMLEHMSDWQEAPIWSPQSIADATAIWFDNLDR